MNSRGLLKQIKQHPIYFDGDQFSEVTEERTSEIEAEEEEDKEEQPGWAEFHKEKIELQKLRKQLFGAYVQYRKNLTEALSEYCTQTDNLTFNYSKYIQEQQVFEKKNQEVQEMRESKEEDIEQKITMVSKILDERRIKRYYKNKYQINVQDELDPEDDQRQIYQYYEEIFGGHPVQNAPSSILAPHQLTTHVHPPIHAAEYSIISSSINEPKSAYHTEQAAPGINTSINRQHYQTDPSKSAVSKHQFNEYLYTGNQLSFDPRNEHHFASHKMEVTDSFGVLHQQDHNDVMSEGGHNSRPHREEDQLSHKDNIYKNFISMQNQQLMLQKMKVQELTSKAMKVLNNDEIDEQQLMGDENQPEHEHEDDFSNFKEYLGELVEIFSVAECLKFILKYKSFELINKLFQNASTFYEEQILFEQPLTVKHMSQIISAALPEESEEAVRVVVENIFGKETEISYEQFLDKMTPSINDHQFDSLKETLVDTSTTSVFELTVGLFGLWVEYEYFQKRLKELLHAHPNLTERFLSIVSEEGSIIIPFVGDLLGKNKKGKEKKLKIQIFLRRILGDNIKNSEFYKWVETRKVPLNDSFEQIKETEKLDYFYNLY